MKKLIAAGLLFLASLGAHAIDGYHFQPYVGLDATVSSGFKVSELRQEKIQGNTYVGLRLCDFGGVEGGFSLSKRAKDGHRELHAHNSHMSLIGFLPLSPEPKVDFIASVGLSHIRATIKDIQTHQIRKSVPRAMVGVQYLLVDSVSLRPSVLWEKSSKFSHPKLTSKDMFKYGLGLQYSF